MDDGPDTTLPECREDRRVRELVDALDREREARERVERTSEETWKVVHTLNNVLCIVTAYAAILAEDVGAGHPLRESVEEIARAAGKAGELTRQLGELRRRARKGEPNGQGRA